MNLGLDGEGALIVASQNIKGDTGDEVDFRIERDGLGAAALVLVGNGAVQWQLGGGLGVIDCDAQFEVEGEGQANDIKSGANVGRGARDSNGKG